MIIEDVRGLFAQESVLLRWVEGSGRILPEVLTGLESTLETLFPRGSSDFANELYHRMAAARYCNNIVRAVVEAFVAGVPQGTPLRILEVGAGTGSTTALILPALAAVPRRLRLHRRLRLLPGAGQAAVCRLSVRTLRPTRPGERSARSRLRGCPLRPGGGCECFARDSRFGADSRGCAIAFGTERHASALRGDGLAVVP